MKDDITQLNVAKELKVMNFRMFSKKKQKIWFVNNNSLLITRVNENECFL